MALYNDGVSYMKTTRADTPMLYDASEEFPIGGCKVLKSSTQDRACIVAAGITLHEALKAYDILKQQNITVAVIDLYSIKPLNRDTLISVGTNAGKTIITVEDHYAEGGMGEAVASALCNTGIAVHSRAVTKLPRSGSPEALMKLEGIDAESIVEVVKNSIK
jgi:transketolase